MKRFEKYFNSLNVVDIANVPAAEIEAIIDKKFVLDISLYASFKHSCFTVGLYDDDIEDEVIANFEDIPKFEDIIPLLYDMWAEFNIEHEDDSCWWLHGKTKPISAKEVLKIKNKYDPNELSDDRIYSADIVNLVEK